MLTYNGTKTGFDIGGRKTEPGREVGSTLRPWENHEYIHVKPLLPLNCGKTEDTHVIYEDKTWNRLSTLIKFSERVIQGTLTFDQRTSSLVEGLYSENFFRGGGRDKSSIGHVEGPSCKRFLRDTYSQIVSETKVLWVRFVVCPFIFYFLFSFFPCIPLGLLQKPILYFIIF